MSLPFVDITGTGSTTNTVVLSKNANTTTDDYYKGYSIKLNNESTTNITAYKASTSTATVETAFKTAPAAGLPYIICDSSVTVKFVGLVAASSTVTSVVFVGSSSSDSAYDTMYLTIGTETKLIKSYSGSKLTATIDAPGFSTAPITGEAFSVCTTDPSAFLFGLNTSFIGGSTFFKIAIVSIIVIICLCSIVSLFFVISSKGDGSGGRGGGGNRMGRGLETQAPQIPITMSFSPQYFPPVYNTRI